jgi:hypothetical protein
MFNKQGSDMFLQIAGRAAYIALGIVIGVWLVTSGVLI